MAGKRIPPVLALRNALQMWRKHRRHTEQEIEVSRRRYGHLAELLNRYTGRPVSAARVLDVGCGQRAVLPLLFAANGAEACAVDVEMPTYDMDFSEFFSLLSTFGVHRAAKSLARRALFDRRFFAGLAQACRVALKPFPSIDVRVCDIARANLPDHWFDLVSSYDVLGHVADVESAVQNVNATLREDGVGYIVIHLFPSLTGGDCFDWVFALDPAYGGRFPTNVLPWDHLRENRYPSDSFLNRMRLRDYQDIFYRHTIVVAESHQPEGRELLSQAPPELLAEYTEEDLTTAFVAFTIRRKT